jgi:hypothetical protein
MTMYEARRQQLLSRPRFFARVGLHVAMAAALLAVSVGVGMAGYVVTEGMSGLDAFLNVAMLLGGMGPVNPPVTSEGKLFAGLFALYAGLVFIVCAAIVLTPVLHRVLHRFHLEDRD